MHLEAGLEHCPTGAGTVREFFSIIEMGLTARKGENMARRGTGRQNIRFLAL